MLDQGKISRVQHEFLSQLVLSTSDVLSDVDVSIVDIIQILKTYKKRY